MVGGRYRDFQHGLALATSKVLNTFAPENVALHQLADEHHDLLRLLGHDQHALVPDIGILAGRDIVAIEKASLDMIRTRDLIPGTLPAKLELGKKGHLFERIHGKDPYAVIGFMDELGHGTKKFKLTEVE